MAELRVTWTETTKAKNILERLGINYTRLPGTKYSSKFNVAMQDIRLLILSQSDYTIWKKKRLKSNRSFSMVLNNAYKMNPIFWEKV